MHALKPTACGLPANGQEFIQSALYQEALLWHLMHFEDFFSVFQGLLYESINRNKSYIYGMHQKFNKTCSPDSLFETNSLATLANDKVSVIQVTIYK